MMDDEKCCITCVYCILMPLDELMCDCEESDGYGLEILHGDFCGEWKER